MITGLKPEPTLVFEDREVPDQWRGEKFDDDDGCEVQIFTGPDTREHAIDYASMRYVSFIVKRRLEPTGGGDERRPCRWRSAMPQGQASGGLTGKKAEAVRSRWG